MVNTPIPALRVMLKAAQRRHEAEWRRTAWAVAHLMNVSGKVVKRPVTVDQLLRRKRPKAVLPTDLGIELMAAVTRQLGGRDLRPGQPPEPPG